MIILLIVLSFFLLLITNFISLKLNLLDYPNFRKTHSVAVPFTGGVAISIVFLFIIFLYDFEQQYLNLILIYCFLISIIGLIDDIYKLNVGGKLCLQGIPVILLIYESNLYLTDLGEYFYIGIIELGSFSKLFTIFCIFLIINAANYHDGVDGSLSMIVLTSIFGLLLYKESLDKEFVEFLIVITIPILIFVLFNFSMFGLPKIFLGDSGSLMLGFLISFLLISISINYNIHPINLAWFVGFFVFEFLTVNINRVINRKNIFKAGKDHLHYLLLKINKSLIKTNFIIFSISFFIILSGYIIGLQKNYTLSALIFLLYFVTYYKISSYLKNISNAR